MHKLTKFELIVLAGCASVFAFFVGCSGSDSEPSAPSDLRNPFVIKDTTIVNVNGDSIHKRDTIYSQIDTIMKITEQGETTYVADTIYVGTDTTLHWVGNSALVITEISPLNLDWNDEDGSDGSWVEIYNAGTQDANLKGYSLVENLKEPRKWVFGNEIIKSKKFRIVFCDKKNLVTAAKPNDEEITTDEGSFTAHYRTHTNWRMDKSGGTVYLIDPNYAIRDSVKFPEMTSGISWGITDGGIWKFFDKPTPESENTNSTGYDDLAPNVDLSALKAGFYNDAITINPPQLESGVKLRCTQDGSEPKTSSQEFNSPITISSNTAFRCAAFKEGTLTTKVISKTFFIGEESTSMPIVAISVNPSFFDKHYVKTSVDKPEQAPSGLYEEVEFPVHVEYFEKGTSTKEVSWEIDAGISLMGGYSRLNDKKSVAIKMNEQYQDGWLNYPLFETRKGVNDKFKGFNLRNNGNRFVSDYIEDAVGGAILEGSGVDYQRSRQVIVYYNGKYYGIHDMRERFNKNYVETNYGIDASTVNMVKHLGLEVEASNGGINDYVSMLSYIAQNDFSGENNENYAYAKTLIDMGNYADYMAAEIYYHNGDWPANNVRAWKSPDNPWKFMVYDLDHGFGWKWNVEGFGEETNMFTWIKHGGITTGKCHSESNKDKCFHTIYNQLIKNPDFKRLFINRSAVMLTHYLTSERVASAVDKMVASIPSTDMDRDLGHYHQNEMYYPDGFSREGSSIKSWASSRNSKVESEYKSEFDLGDLVTVNISANGSGHVLMEGMKLPSQKYSGKFFSGNLMELTAIAESGAVFNGWSDGVTDNPRIVTVADGLSISADFK